MSMRKWSRIASRAVALVTVALVLSSCGSWKGIANVPLPGGPGGGPDKMTIYVQMPDTLALNVNSRVRVADVYVGRVREIALKNWVATLTLDLQPGLPNDRAGIGDHPHHPARRRHPEPGFHPDRGQQPTDRPGGPDSGVFES